MLTGSGDIVLIHYKNQPVSYARVEHIVADVKQGWWQVTLLLLSVPTKKVTWILREEYIDGDEFTMGGENMRLERQPPPQVSEPFTEPPEPKNPITGRNGKSNKVISLYRRHDKYK